MQTQILCMYNKIFRVKALKYPSSLCLFATLRKPSRVLRLVCLYSLELHVYAIDLLLSPAPPHPKRAESSKKHKHTYKNVYPAFVLYYAKFVEEKGLESPAVPKPKLVQKPWGLSFMNFSEWKFKIFWTTSQNRNLHFLLRTFWV